jgi:predicted O-methyltransferase YrrM
VSDGPPDSGDWADRVNKLRSEVDAGNGLWRYLDMVRRHSDQQRSVNWYKSTAFFTLPILLRAERIVELGASFSVYPDTYGSPPDPWGPAGEHDEGVVSTRLFLAACHVLRHIGVQARVTSIDIRESTNYANVERLFAELGLREYWDPQMGTDSLDWLAAEAGRLRDGRAAPIDFALVDSHHTHHQVSRELAGLLPLMAPGGAILVDDCYRTDFQVDAGWMPDETDQGRERGGEFGAVIEFLALHPEWRPHWMQHHVLLSRALELPDAPPVIARPASGMHETGNVPGPDIIPAAVASWLRQHAGQGHTITVRDGAMQCGCGAVRAFPGPG